MLTFGSLFAGVGGFDLGFESAGYDCRFQVEWDKHCQQVLAYRWPDVPRWADVSEVSGAVLPPVDVITYGFPCQDLSVAGRRAGLDGERSHLFFEAVRIITEMREATDGRYPIWAVAENVAGLLNADGGHAMGRVVDELADAGAMVIEWTTLDAQHFGVPQRRRRVFIASCFDPATADRCPDPLFPVGTGSSRDTATSEEPRQGTAADVGTGVAFSNGSIAIGFSHTQGIDCQPSTDTFPTLRREGNGMAAAIPIQDGREMEKHQNELGVGDAGDPAYTLDTTGGQAVAQPDVAVRRLTPIECERLMGWPDNHTLHRADGKTNADSSRYKMCGNGVVAPVAAWLAKHLAKTFA